MSGVAFRVAGMGMVVDETRPWWLWPNLLALDAPAVAVVWQQFLARAAGVRVPAVAAVVLGLVVWGVYLGDRWLDARRGLRTADRHRFAARHRLVYGTAAAVALVAAAACAVWLPGAYLVAGGVVALGLAGYLAAVHAGGRVLGPGAKEATVGVVFGGGVAVPLLADVGLDAAAWLPGALAFAGLCALNCALISRWEDAPADAPPRWTAFFAAGVTLLAGVAAAPPVRAAVLASVGLLVALHAARGRLPTPACRVLADVALLTPLAFGVVP